MIWEVPLPAMGGLCLEAPPVGIGAGTVSVPVVVLAGVPALGTPINSRANPGNNLVWPPAIDLPRPEVNAARTLVDLAQAAPLDRKGRVAGPENVDFAVSVLTSRVKAVNPRASYLRGRHVDKSFAADDRRVLSHALTHGYAEWGLDAVAEALRSLQPDAVCLAVGLAGNSVEVTGVLDDAGYQAVGTDEICGDWARTHG